MEQETGITSAELIYNVAEVELVYKPRIKPSMRPVIKDSKSMYDLLLQTWDSNNIELFEQFKAVLLNRAGKVLGILCLSAGTMDGTLADPKLLFCAALKAAASSIVIAHNHPSGNLNPSKPDELITNRIKEGGKLLDIRLLDHLIVTPEGYYSFADNGQL